jgi:hypothetical protein
MKQELLEKIARVYMSYLNIKGQNKPVIREKIKVE